MKHTQVSRVNIKSTPYSDGYNNIDKLFKSLCSIYQGNLESLMKGSDFIFDSVQLLYYKCHKVDFRGGGSCIDSPNWIKKKKATINPKNTDHKLKSKYQKRKNLKIIKNIKFENIFKKYVS